MSSFGSLVQLFVKAGRWWPSSDPSVISAYPSWHRAGGRKRPGQSITRHHQTIKITLFNDFLMKHAFLCCPVVWWLEHSPAAVITTELLCCLTFKGPLHIYYISQYCLSYLWAGPTRLNLARPQNHCRELCLTLWCYYIYSNKQFSKMKNIFFKKVTSQWETFL